MSGAEAHICEGPYHCTEVEARKQEALKSAAEFQAPELKFQTPDCDSIIENVHITQRFDRTLYALCRELSDLRAAGASFCCNLRSEGVESDTISITRRGRIILTQDNELSVILPDELLSMSNKTATGRWLGFHRKKLDRPFIFLVRWWARIQPVREGPRGGNAAEMSTYVFMEENGEDFEAIMRTTIARSKQARWCQMQALSARVGDMARPFDAALESHATAMVQLWNRIYPEHPAPLLPPLRRSSVGGAEKMEATAAAHMSWTYLGFPTEAPGDLFNGPDAVGILGLKQLLHLAEHRPFVVQAVVGKVPGSSQMDLAGIGTRVTRMLARIGFDDGLKCEPRPLMDGVSPPSAQPLVRVLHNCDHATALEDVYALAFDVVILLLSRRGYSSSNNVPHVLHTALADTEAFLRDSLGNLPTNIEELAILLHQCTGQHA
eukprot:m.1548842 g.1548842  ORF g.1548842 m.1548842 type:complete len:436 (+) comp25264_c0_seq18:153-1460(+)